MQLHILGAFIVCSYSYSMKILLICVRIMLNLHSIQLHKGGRRDCQLLLQQHETTADLYNKNGVSLLGTAAENGSLIDCNVCFIMELLLICVIMIVDQHFIQLHIMGTIRVLRYKYFSPLRR